MAGALTDPNSSTKRSVGRLAHARRLAMATHENGQPRKNKAGLTYTEWLVEAGRASSDAMRWAWSKGHRPSRYKDILTEPKVPRRLLKHL